MMALAQPGATVWCYSIGSQAELQDGTKVTIISIMVRGTEILHMEYEVAWIYSGERKTAWVQTSEIASAQKKIPMGFIHDPD